MRKTARHRPNDLNAVPAKIPQRARRHGSGHSYQRARHPRCKAVQQQQGSQHGGGNRQGRRMHLGQSSEDLGQL